MPLQKTTLSEQYQKKTDREHILDAPDTYIGSIEKDNIQGWNYVSNSDRIEYNSFEFIPGLYKCFDEGIVNSRDHFIRMKMQQESDIHKVSYISVEVDKSTGMISITNDGNGIDIEKHPEHGIWIPEMIFGHLRTSTNYQKDKVRIVGGKNGFGFKLVLIYSTWGRIETVDHTRGKKYIQEFKDNLTVIEKPKITKCKGKPYTKVSWIPDYKRFGVNKLTDTMESIFHKRVIDISATTDKSLKVKYNKESIPVHSFEQYVNMYVGNKTTTKRIYEKANERWEYAVCLTPFDEFTQVSFVNGICTTKGGKHVDYILNQITKSIVDYIEKKKKVKVKPTSIKEQLFLFVNCIIDNPSFDSQTKDTLTTNVTKFGSTCKVSEKFVEKIAKLGIIDQALSIHSVKESKESKKTDGKKTKSLYGIPKLIDAHYAGTAKSKQCILILCEGDSAKAGIVSGLSKEDRNTIGVYPLRGKLINARDAQKSKLNANNEITEIKKIMGLESNRQYVSKSDIDSLRYGKIVLLTDQDLDGVHIKGLCVNLFDSHWNSLIKEEEFIGFMNTPILKAKKGSKEIVFYNEKEYDTWKQQNNVGWNVKYYKGLGTSTSKEFKEYFKNKKIISFCFDQDSSNALDMVFNKSRSEDRKHWLEQYDKDKTLDTNQLKITYNEFVHNELIHFSKYDCERSIPNIMDGLKTSQRKILFCAFKRNLTKEIKVAQFGGYVSEHSGYHHGETSLMQAMVGMAQDFVGSNNINLLQPNGQFGTRLQGGSDSASERYIFTQLNKITRTLFPENDDKILHYLEDDGQRIEPEFYAPIIPMVLINGALGIGTGFSTYIPQFNPLDIVDRIKLRLQNSQDDAELIPWYKNFKGEIIKIKNANQILIKGKYHVEKKDQLRITELPIGVWTDSYKAYLEKLMNDKSYIREYQDMSTDTKVDILVTFQNNKLQNLLDKSIDENVNELDKYMNLYTSKKYNNMHLFDEKQQLQKFDKPEDIIQYYIPIRLLYYQRRIDVLLKALERECTVLNNKARFIQEQCDDTIDLRRKSRTDVIQLLNLRKYDTLNEEDVEFKYLRNMPVDSFVEENIKKLLDQCKEKEILRQQLKSTTPKQLWISELDNFIKEMN